MNRSGTAAMIAVSLIAAMILRPSLAADVARGDATADRARAHSFPHFAKDSPYAALRDKLIAGGWRPASTAAADKCETGDARCAGRSEMQSCAGTGLGDCLFLWRMDDALFAVSTVGDPAIVSAVECRSHCR